MCWLGVSMLPTAGVQICCARDQTILSIVTRDFHIYSPICPECSRSRGRRTRPRFRRSDGFRAREHGKDQIAISASDLGESGLAHPRELLADGRGQVMFHPLNRGIEVTLCHFQFACALGPHLTRALLDSRGLASDLVGIDEDAAGSQVLEDVGEKMTLAAVG